MAINAGDIVWNIGADATNFNKAVNQTRNDLKRLGTSFSNISKQTGIAFTAAGAAITGALGLAVKEAISFETAFTGTKKTIEEATLGAGKDFATLEQAIRDLAKEVPVTFEELAGIAEIAGQLGVVGQESITGFTETMAKLGATTNLSSEEAATGIARIGNVLGVTGEELGAFAGKFGSVLVELGNNFAVTESELVAMTTRLTSTGAIANISAADLAALAAALASTGTEAALGGTAMQSLSIAMLKATQEGGEALEAFADTAGMSVDDFKKLFKEDALGAIIEFVEGLGKSGDDAIGILEKVELNEKRLIGTLFRLAGGIDTLRDARVRANGEWEKANALDVEFEQRAATVASQLRILKNNWDDISSTLGKIFLPIINKAVAFMIPVLDRISAWIALNPQLTETITLAAAAVGAILLALGPLLIMLPGLVLFFQGLGVIIMGMTGPMLAFAAIIGAVLVPAFFILKSILEQASVWARANWDQIVSIFKMALDNLKTTMKIIGVVIQAGVKIFNAVLSGFAKGTGDAFKKISKDSGSGSKSFLDNIQGMFVSAGEILDNVLIAVDKFSEFIDNHWDNIVKGARFFAFNVMIPLFGFVRGVWRFGGMLHEAFLWIGDKVEKFIKILERLQEIKNALGIGNINIPGVPGFASGGVVKGYASGGVTDARLIKVGERGPELLAAPVGSRVLSHPDMMKAAQRGQREAGPITQTFQIMVDASGVNDPTQMFEIIKTPMMEFMASGMKAAQA